MKQFSLIFLLSISQLFSMDTKETVSTVSEITLDYPVHCAVRDNKPTQLKFYIQHGSNLNIQTPSGITPLMLCAEKVEQNPTDLLNRQMLTLLLRSSCNRELKNNSGKRAIDYITHQEIKSLFSDSPEKS